MIEKSSHSSGVTLIELLVTISILAILLTVAVPSFQSFIANNRVDTFANNLFSSFLLARSEGIKRNKQVMVCRSSNGTSCSGAWNEGWIVFVDTNKNGSPAGDSTEPILLKISAQEGSFNLSGLSNDVYYDSQGKASENDTLEICPTAPAPNGRGKNLIIAPSGAPSVTKKTNCS